MISGRQGGGGGTSAHGSSHSSEELEINSCHYLLLDSNILDNILKIVGVCPTCNSEELELCNNISRKKGSPIASKSNGQLVTSDYFFSTYTSKRVRQDSVVRGQSPFDIMHVQLLPFAK